MATPTTKSTDVTSGYKQTEAGVIPEEWDVQTLSAVSSMKSGQGITASRIDQHSQYPCYGGNGLRGFTSTYTHDGEFALIGRQGALCGNVVGVQGKLFASEHAVVVTPRQGTSIRFLTYVLGDMQLNRLSEASAQPGLSVSKILQLSIALPKSEHEQHAIAAALSDVDELLGSLDRLIAKKRDLKKAAMQQLLTGKKRLPGFQGEWERKLFGELFAFSGGYSASRAQLTTEGHRYLHYGDIHTSNKTVVDVDADHGQLPRLPVAMSKVSPASLLSDGDVVFVDASEDAAGTSKHVVVKNETKRPFISGLHTIVAKQKMKSFCREYLCHCFQTHDVRRQFLFYAVGTKVSGVSKGNIGKIEIPVPHISEQTAIAEVLSDMDSEIEALEAKLAKARQLKQGMMQELLTGRIRLV